MLQQRVHSRDGDGDLVFALARHLEVATEHGRQLATLLATYDSQISQLRSAMGRIRHYPSSDAFEEMSDAHSTVSTSTFVSQQGCPRSKGNKGAGQAPRFGRSPSEGSQASSIRERSAEAKARSVRERSAAYSQKVEQPPARVQEEPDDLTAKDNLAKSILNGDEAGAKDLLQRPGANPNVKIYGPVSKGVTYEYCSPLALALLQGEQKIAGYLLKAKALPTSEYSFVAGALKVSLTFPSYFAIAPTGNIHLLKQLAETGVDMHYVAKCNNSNLMWQAALNGHVAMVQFLGEHKVDMEVAAWSLDDKGASNTPLHVAARFGHKDVVHALIQMEANVLVDDGNGHSVVDDVLNHHHSEIMTLLMRNKCEIIADEHQRDALDRAFERSNPAMIASIAEGLSSDIDQVERLRKYDVIRFLKTPGRAPLSILQAIFHKTNVQFWSDDVKERHRIHFAAVFVPTKNKSFVDAHMMNVARGPHARVLRDTFLSKTAPGADEKAFFSSLAPAQCTDSHFVTTMHSSLDVYFCPIYRLLDLEVVKAIADTPSRTIYGLAETQAIVETLWNECQYLAVVDLTTSLLFIFLLVLITTVTHEYEGNAGDPSHLDPARGKDLWLRQRSFAWVGIMLWLVTLVQEWAQLVGYAVSGLFQRYIMDVGNVLDHIRIGLSGAVLIAIPWTQGECLTDYYYTKCLTLVILWIWIRVAMTARTVYVVGLMILPIFSSLRDILPFLLVLFFCLSATLHAYCTIAPMTHWPHEQMFFVWRAVIFGEHPGAEEFFNESLELGAQDVLLFVASFIGAILLINILIAVLSLSYQEGYTNAYLIFMKRRCKKISQHIARQRLMMVFQAKVLGATGRTMRSKSSDDLDDAPGSVRDLMAACPSTSKSYSSKSHGYLWFCRPTERAQRDFESLGIGSRHHAIHDENEFAL